MYVLDELFGKSPHDRLDNGCPRSLALHGLDRLGRTADAVTFRGLEGDQHSELEPFLPQDRRQRDSSVSALCQSDKYVRTGRLRTHALAAIVCL